jgi:hypothetical protein
MRARARPLTLAASRTHAAASTKGRSVTPRRSIAFLAGAPALASAVLALAAGGGGSGGSTSTAPPKTTSGGTATVGVAKSDLGNILVDA